MKSVTTSDPEFNLWWKEAQERDEYRGVPMAAAYGIWLKGKGKDGGLVEEPKPPPLPEAFTKYWETASQLAEFRGQTLAAHYATWLAALKWAREGIEKLPLPSPKDIVIETPKRKRSKEPVVAPVGEGDGEE